MKHKTHKNRRPNLEKISKIDFFRTKLDFFFLDKEIDELSESCERSTFERSHTFRICAWARAKHRDSEKFFVSRKFFVNTKNF